MLRWMISPIIGSGTATDAYRASVSDVTGVNSTALIPSKPHGSPKYHFALWLAATANVSLIAAVSNAYVFPDYNLDGQMAGMDGDARTALVQSVQAYNLDGNGLHLDASNDDIDSYRDLITTIGQQIDSAFLPNNTSCAEVTS